MNATSATEIEKPKAKRQGKRRKGRGTVYKRADGRWCAELPIGSGKRKFFYGATEGEVDAKLTAAKATLDAGGVLGDGKTTVGVILDRFLEERAGRVRANTIESYQRIVALHLKPHLGRVLARKLTAADVQAFVTERGRAGLSPAMVHHALVVLRMALSLAEDWNLVLRNVAKKVNGPMVERPDLPPLDADDTGKLLVAARQHRLGAVWYIAASLGLRLGEILGLRWSDLDLDTGALTVRHQLAFAPPPGDFASRALLAPPKTKRGNRTLHLAPGLVALLRERKAAQARERLKAGAAWDNRLALAFTSLRGHPFDGRTVAAIHAELCKTAGVRRVRFHDLRHGAATLMLGAGVDVVNLSASLGHADVAFTLSRYAHATRPKMDDAVGRLAGVLGLS